MRIAELPHAETSQTTPLNFNDFNELEEHIASTEIRNYERKLSIPVFTACSFKGDGKKCNENAGDVCIAVLDIDGGGFGLSKAGLDSLLETLERNSYRYILYLSSGTFTKRKHKGDGEVYRCGYKVRVILELSEPVPPVRWKKVWSNLYTTFGKQIDSQCKAPSHGYFYPARLANQDHPDYYDEEMFYTGGHRPLRSDLLYKAPFEIDFPELELEHPGLGNQTKKVDETYREDGAELKGLFNCNKSALQMRLRAAIKSGGENKVLGESLLASFNEGSPFTMIGNRDQTLWEYAKFLGFWCKVYIPSTVAERFQHSISHMLTGDPQEDAGISVEGFAEKIVRAQEYQEKKEQEKQARRLKEEKRKLQELGKRTEPYSDDEKQAMSEELCSGKSVENHLILYMNKEFYFLSPEGYKGPYFENEWLGAAEQELYPFILDGTLSLTKRNKMGDTIAKTKNEILWDYAFRVDRQYYDLAAQKNNLAERDLCLAPTPIVDLEPEFSEDFDRYLFRLCGRNQGRLKDLRLWLAALPEVGRPLAALVLSGPPGTGKSFLAQQLAQVWGKDASDLDLVLGANFQSSIVKNPFLFADEKLPEKSSAGIRRLVQQRSMEMNVKHQNLKDVIGSPRIVIATNNMQHLAFKEYLNKYDIEAIASRFRVIEVPEDLKSWHEHNGDIREQWVQNQTIAKHVLYLNQTIDHKAAKDRFVVPSWGDDVFRYLNVRTYYNSMVCHWIVSFLEDMTKGSLPGPDKSTRPATVIYEDGEPHVLVTSSAVYEHWDHYQRTKRPGIINIGEILDSLSLRKVEVLGDSRKLQLIPGNDTSKNANIYFDIDIRNLHAWAHLTSKLSIQKLDRAILKTAEDDTKRHQDRLEHKRKANLKVVPKPKKEE